MPQIKGQRWLCGVIVLCLLGLEGCASKELDLKAMTLHGLSLNEDLTPQRVIHVLGRPDEEGKSRRWFWRPPRRYLKYFQRGFEVAFDSEGRTYDPITAKFFRLYIFLRPESHYLAFSGRISKGVTGKWGLKRLEEAFGPPEKTRKVGSELEWIYGVQKPFQTVFIAEASSRKLKAIMIIRSERERPL